MTDRRFNVAQFGDTYIVTDTKQPTMAYASGFYWSWWRIGQPQVRYHDTEASAQKQADELEMLWRVPLPDLPQNELKQFMIAAELRILREVMSGAYAQPPSDVYVAIYKWRHRLLILMSMHDLHSDLTQYAEWAWQFTTLGDDD